MEIFNFTYREFIFYYNLLADNIEEYIYRRRGPQCEKSGMDLPFTLMVTMRIGTTWTIRGQMFRIKGNTSERKIFTFAKFIALHMEKLFV